MLDFHPQFLKATKSVYPLGVLSSLSMAIAAFITSFGKDSLVLAQTYAIAASLMFLFAFTSSIVLGLFFGWEKKNPGLGYYALTSYICTGSGIAFLSLVVYEFIVSVLPIARVLVPVFTMVVIGAILLLALTIINIIKIPKLKGILVLGYLTIICYLLFASALTSIILSVYGVISPLPTWWGYLLTGSLYLGLIFFSVLLILMIVQTLKRRK
jgi:hypothetical protein